MKAFLRYLFICSIIGHRFPVVESIWQRFAPSKQVCERCGVSWFNERGR